MFHAGSPGQCLDYLGHVFKPKGCAGLRRDCQGLRDGLDIHALQGLGFRVL